MGGSLKLVAEFPDGCAVLSSLGESLDEEPSEKRKRGVVKAPRGRRLELAHG